MSFFVQDISRSRKKFDNNYWKLPCLITQPDVIIWIFSLYRFTSLLFSTGTEYTLSCSSCSVWPCDYFGQFNVTRHDTSRGLAEFWLHLPVSWTTISRVCTKSSPSRQPGPLNKHLGSRPVGSTCCLDPSPANPHLEAEPPILDYPNWSPLQHCQHHNKCLPEEATHCLHNLLFKVLAAFDQNTRYSQAIVNWIEGRPKVTNSSPQAKSILWPVFVNKVLYMYCPWLLSCLSAEQGWQTQCNPENLKYLLSGFWQKTLVNQT